MFESLNEEDYGQIILKHAMIPNLVCYGTMSCGIKSTRDVERK